MHASNRVMQLIVALAALLFCTCYGSELIQYDKSREGTMETVNKLSGSRMEQHYQSSSRKDPMFVRKDRISSQLSVGFLHAFFASISVIIVSELGDKTFFIAAIMAMRYSRATVFLGAMGALGLMTVLSTFLGYATTVIPRKYTFYVSTALFAIFGLRMLKEGYYMDPNEGQEELEEVSAELKKKEAEYQTQKSSGGTEDPETGIIRNTPTKKGILKSLSGIVSPVLLQSFTLTFLAEWGDRSQLTTIILGSREDPVGVTLGGTLGHAICTGLAVLGGRLIAQKISVRTVTLVGGVVFLLFALSALFVDPNAG